MPATKSLEERFWEKVDKNGPLMAHMKTRCWVWVAGLDDGYGKVSFEGKPERAHRVAWILRRGKIPSDKCVLHRCDNRPCVRHLYLGTKKDNAQDREQRGRSNHAVGTRHGRHTHPGQTAGEKNGRAKLSVELVEEILLKHFKQGRRKADLAREYGLSKTAVGHIVSGKLWPNVEGRV